MRHHPVRGWLHTTAVGPLTLANVCTHIDIVKRRDHFAAPELFGPTAFVTGDDVLFGRACGCAVFAKGFDPRS